MQTQYICSINGAKIVNGRQESSTSSVIQKTRATLTGCSTTKSNQQDFHNLPWIFPRMKIRQNWVVQPALNITLLFLFCPDMGYPFQGQVLLSCTKELH